MNGHKRRRRVLVADLNNSARYPTHSVGYFVAVLRGAGWDVDVFSPFLTGVSGVVREQPASPWSLLAARLGYRCAVSPRPWAKRIRAGVASLLAPQLARATRRVARLFEERLDQEPRVDAVLVSTYLMYLPLCQAMAAACRGRGIPLLLGSAGFTQPNVALEWLAINGVTALAAGELETEVPAILEAMLLGDDLAKFQGLWLRGEGGPRDGIAPPRRDLDGVPFPDFSDFPWDRYPNRIIPVITGRGCGWGVCTFCSDIVTAAGRTYRSRSPESVLEGLRVQSERYGTKLFAFTDLKLNSNLELWHALIERFQAVVPGARWIGAVHIDAQGANGLSGEALRAARAGMVRLTTGLESGSQRLLDAMKKGTDLEVTSARLRDARDAGISVRTTMIIGYPGETPKDLETTRDFLRVHRDCIDRINLNRFQIMTGTVFHRQWMKRPQAFPGVADVRPNHRMAQMEHRLLAAASRKYLRAVDSVLSEVHAINRRPILEVARDFEGVM
ncbi:radical SAM protein [Thioalkalivibrio sp. XN279]|uniref:B12-binding domain-containing radical SAM protein n=1 Tax=Thioalkalivibrio sp. XN279 TaxID=2714953 RepID=UPI0014084E3D|nr:radical SAM protein [Thioalkalivibrio sp. XN279]NHA15350.1 B12-binding domain-containing radical SAM protein [Thioalkalivibrio sp. XN279]